MLLTCFETSQTFHLLIGLKWEHDTELLVKWWIIAGSDSACMPWWEGSGHVKQPAWVDIGEQVFMSETVKSVNLSFKFELFISYYVMMTYKNDYSIGIFHSFILVFQCPNNKFIYMSPVLCPNEFTIMIAS